MNNIRRSLIFFAIGLFCFLIWRETETDALMLGGTISIGLGLGISYRPAINDIFISWRLPDRTDIWVVLLSCIHGYTLLGVVDLLFRPTFPSYSDPKELLADQIGWVLMIATGLWAMAPIASQIIRNIRQPGRNAPLWPLATGIGGSALVGFAVFLAWSGFGRHLVNGFQVYGSQPLSGSALLFEAGLFGSIGLALSWRAVNAEEAEVMNLNGIFGTAMRGTSAMLLLFMMVCAGLMALQVGKGTGSFGLSASCWILIILSGLWIFTLRSIRDCDPVSHWRAIAAVAILAFSWPLSILAPFAIIDAQDWAPIFIIILLPMSIAAGVIIVRFLPPMMRRLLTG
jgi:hypothetical protein